MDTLKKEIYMEARRIIASGDTSFLCIALEMAISNVLGTDYPADGDLYELVPEFTAMYDGYLWKSPTLKYPTCKGLPTNVAWWRAHWKEPRLAMIDYLLSR